MVRFICSSVQTFYIRFISFIQGGHFNLQHWVSKGIPMKNNNGILWPTQQERDSKAGQAGVMAEQTMNGLKGPAPGPKTGANLTSS